MATKTPSCSSKKRKRLNPISIRLDDEMLATLRQIAEDEHRPMANLIVAALKEWLAGRDQRG
jgi:predicted transcriptional regulator